MLEGSWHAEVWSQDEAYTIGASATRLSVFLVILRSVFFFQAEDGIRDYKVTGVQTCALPISTHLRKAKAGTGNDAAHGKGAVVDDIDRRRDRQRNRHADGFNRDHLTIGDAAIDRKSVV